MGEGAGQVTGWERPGADPATDASSDADPQVEQLVEEIEVTREEMTVTVEQIGDRLDPRNIVADAKQTVRDATVGKVEQMASDAGQTAQQAGSGLIETIKRNPVPAAMVGIGLGWLAMAARSSGGSGYSGAYGSPGHGFAGPTRFGGARPSAGYGGYDSPTGYGGPTRYGGEPGPWDTGRMGSEPGIGERVGERVGQVGSTAGEKVSQVQQSAGQAVSDVQQSAGQAASDVQRRAGEVADQVGQTAGQAGQQVQDVARQAGDSAGRLFQENPLAVGAIAVAVGAAVGLALPVSPVERRVVGRPASDVLQRAESAASEALGQAEQQARDAEQQARDEDREARAH